MLDLVGTANCWFSQQIVDFILILGTEGEDNLRIQTAKRRHKVSRTKETV